MDEGRHGLLLEIGRRLVDGPAPDGTTYALVGQTYDDAWGATGQVEVTAPDGTVRRLQVSVVRPD